MARKEEAPTSLEKTNETNEQERPLLLPLSEKAQEGLLLCLAQGLSLITKKVAECEHGYTHPDFTEKFDEACTDYIAIIKHTGQKLYVEEAIDLGLKNVVTPEQIKPWANLLDRNDKDIEIKQKARYAIAKKD